VLEVYKNFVEQRFNEISNETWDILIKVVFGVLDYTFCVIQEGNDPQSVSKIVKRGF
jgi:hypothetical protein